MNFTSIKEYFYKLYNVCYLLLLLPLLIFIFIYYQLTEKKIVPIIAEEMQIQAMIAGAILLVIINLTTVHWVSGKRMKVYVTEPGLGRKLDRYYEIIFLRFTAGATSSLLAAIGLLLTGSVLFAAIFIVVLLLLAVQFPTSRKACKELMLKGDEYTMVFKKTEKI
jgi:hypothetical protein